MTTALEQIAANIRRRIAEIDKELSGVDALTAERSRLQRALDDLELDAAPRPYGARKQRAPSKRRGSTKPSSGRARPGVNGERIMSFLAANGPSAASTIAKETGINRGVVYNNLTRLVGEGRATQTDADGTALFASA